MFIKYYNSVKKENVGYPLEDYFASRKEVKAYSEDNKTWIQNEAYDEAYAIDLLKQPNIIKAEQLLKDSDWTQIPDALKNGRITQARKTAFETWRQEVYSAMNETEVDWETIEAERP